MPTYSQFQQIPNRDPAAKTPTPASLRLFERAGARCPEGDRKGQKAGQELGKEYLGRRYRVPSPAQTAPGSDVAASRTRGP